MLTATIDKAKAELETAEAELVLLRGGSPSGSPQDVAKKVLARIEKVRGELDTARCLANAAAGMAVRLGQETGKMLTGPVDNTPAAGSTDQALGRIERHVSEMLGIRPLHGRPRPHPTLPKVDGVNGQPQAATPLDGSHC